uniref:Uncharacterized protein n=1 Tax=Anguilla anguilla TaxID=7936 RepID=A0A0E9TVC4_ANGAN
MSRIASGQLSEINFFGIHKA